MAIELYRVDFRSRYRDTLIVSTFHYLSSANNTVLDPLVELSGLMETSGLQEAYRSIMVDFVFMQRRVVYLLRRLPSERQSLTVDLGNLPGLDLRAGAAPWLAFGIQRGTAPNQKRLAGHLWISGFSVLDIVNGARPVEPMPGTGSRLLASRMAQVLTGPAGAGVTPNYFTPVVVARRPPFPSSSQYRYGSCTRVVPTPGIRIRRTRRARPGGRPDPGLLPL